MVEKSLGVQGDEILYVGDHIYTDVSQSKVHLRWRTALICRELEEEVFLVVLYLDQIICLLLPYRSPYFTFILQYNALVHSRGDRAALIELINQKEVVGDLFNQLRLALQRRGKGRPAQVTQPPV